MMENQKRRWGRTMKGEKHFKRGSISSSQESTGEGEKNKAEKRTNYEKKSNEGEKKKRW